MAEQSAAPLSAALVRLMAVSVGVVVANLYYPQPLLPELGRTFDLSVTEVGAVAMTGMLGAGIGQIIFVPLGDILDRRRLILLLISASAAGLALTATAQTALWLIVATFLTGLTASVNHVTIPFAAHLAPAEQRGRVVGTVISGLLLGVLLARTYAGWIGEWLGWRAVFAIATIVIATLAAALYRWLPPSEPASVNLRWPQLIASAWPLWRSQPVLREAVLVNSLLFCTFSGFWTAMVFFLEGPPYFYTSRGAGLFGLIGAAGAICAPYVGRLTDRYGGRTNVLVAVITMMAAFAVLGLLGTSLAAFILGVLLLDLGQQTSHVTNQSRIYGLLPEARSRLNMIYMTCSLSGGAAGSYLSTWWWNRAGWAGVCGFSMTLLALALFLWWRLGARMESTR